MRFVCVCVFCFSCLRPGGRKRQMITCSSAAMRAASDPASSRLLKDQPSFSKSCCDLELQARLGCFQAVNPHNDVFHSSQRTALFTQRSLWIFNISAPFCLGIWGRMLGKKKKKKNFCLLIVTAATFLTTVLFVFCLSLAFHAYLFPYFLWFYHPCVFISSFLFLFGGNHRSTRARIESYSVKDF